MGKLASKFAILYKDQQAFFFLIFSMSLRKAEFYADFNAIEKVAITIIENFVSSNKFGKILFFSG